MMHNDVQPVGRLLSRREALALFGASAASLAPSARAKASAADPVLAAVDCIAQPEQTEGPFPVMERGGGYSAMYRIAMRPGEQRERLR
jgi:hypothetical protein